MSGKTFGIYTEQEVFGAGLLRWNEFEHLFKDEDIKIEDYDESSILVFMEHNVFAKHEPLIKSRASEEINKMKRIVKHK